MNLGVKKNNITITCKNDVISKRKELEFTKAIIGRIVTLCPITIIIDQCFSSRFQLTKIINNYLESKGFRGGFNLFEIPLNSSFFSWIESIDVKIMYWNWVTV